MARRFHKYGKRTRDGFRSGFESEVAKDLSNCGVPWTYETQKYDLVIPRRYTPDFVLGNGRVIEVKGYFDSEDRRKDESKAHDLLRKHYAFRGEWFFCDASLAINKLNVLFEKDNNEDS